MPLTQSRRPYATDTESMAVLPSQELYDRVSAVAAPLWHSVPSRAPAAAQYIVEAGPPPAHPDNTRSQRRPCAHTGRDGVRTGSHEPFSPWHGDGTFVTLCVNLTCFFLTGSVFGGIMAAMEVCRGHIVTSGLWAVPGNKACL